MNLRAKAAAIANQFEGRCTCGTMDGGVECRWCQVFRELLRTQPLDPRPTRPATEPAASLSTG
jgi:hypothetical protein